MGRWFIVEPFGRYGGDDGDRRRPFLVWSASATVRNPCRRPTYYTATYTSGSRRTNLHVDEQRGLAKIVLVADGVRMFALSLSLSL